MYTRATGMNAHSSRSHAVLCIEVIQEDSKNGLKLHGQFRLVDLAGSEKVKKTAAAGQRLREAQSINKSLSSLI